MADIVEDGGTFPEAVYLIDGEDPVDAVGQEAVDNRPHTALANRTRFLKINHDALSAEVIAARSGKASLAAKINYTQDGPAIDGAVADAAATKAEVAAARDGKPTLAEKIDYTVAGSAIDGTVAGFIDLLAEVLAAREGEASLLDALAARMDGFLGNRVLSGWGLANLSGTQVDVVAGSGRLGGVLHETAAPTTVTGLTPGQINYIRVQAGVGGVPVFTPAASKLAGAVYVGHVDMVGEVLVTYAPDGTAEMAFTPIAAGQTLTFNHQLGRVPRRDEIDLLFRPVGTTGEADFHPTFQVEAADGAGVAIRAVTDTQLVIQAGNGAPGYNAFYTLGAGGTLVQYASGSIKCSIRRRVL